MSTHNISYDKVIIFHNTTLSGDLLLRAISFFAYEPPPEISNNVVCATSKASDQPVHTRILIRALASPLISL